MNAALTRGHSLSFVASLTTESSFPKVAARAVQFVARRDFVLDEILGVFGDGVGRLPEFDLFLAAVARRVGGGVPRHAVGDGVEEDGAAAFQQNPLLAGHGIGDREGIVAVHALGVHVLGIDAGADAGQDLVAHGLAVGLAAHAVEIVEEVEEDGRGSAYILVPESPVLVHRGEAHGLPDRSAAHGGVADVGDDDARLAVDPLEQRRSRRDVGRAADYGIVRHGSEGREESVHGASEAPVESGLAGEYLGEGSEEDKIFGAVEKVLRGDRVDEPEGLAVQEALHHGLELARGQ